MNKLTTAEAYALQVKKDRRAAALDRNYGEAVVVKTTEAPTFTPATTFTVTRLAGGMKARVAAEKAAKTRRERRAAKAL
jgi:hypothetical protein